MSAPIMDCCICAVGCQTTTARPLRLMYNAAMPPASTTEGAQRVDLAAPPTAPGSIAIARPAPEVAGSPVPYLTLLLFYLPLGFSGLMMTLDLPVVNALLNRLPDPNVSVAALRVAFSLALVYEAAHISMIDVSAALSSDLRVFAMLRRF